ncbi:MAG: hypothetical protein LBR06_10325 [Bacteroidales bacterium]|nr:hypothetical protein [Bacteroidales bacterium]
MLCLLLAISRDAGISGDEEVHARQAEYVYEWYASAGQDTRALDTPETHLRYYGQSPDNIACILTRWLRIDDIYLFRHLFSSFLGWLAIFITARFACWLRGYGAGLWVLLLFAVSPRFMGHLQNNLKDVPFALACIACVYYTLKLESLRFRPVWRDAAMLAAGLAFALSIRAGGLLMYCYLLLAVAVHFAIRFRRDGRIALSDMRQAAYTVGGTVVAGYIGGMLLWPYALQNPLMNVWESYCIMAHFPTLLRQIFEGSFVWSDLLPRHYLPKYMLLTIPAAVFAGLLLFCIFCKKITASSHFRYAFIAFSAVFPVAFVLLLHSNLYGGWRHFIFVYPSLVLLSAVGFHELFRRVRRRAFQLGAGIMLGLMMVHPLRFMIQAHPYYYLYYNELAGGLKGAYRHYETDYYYHTMRSGAEWLRNELKQNNTGTAVIGSNFNISWYFRDMPTLEHRYFQYAYRHDVDWDYAVVGNSYISPAQLLHFPPAEVIHSVEVDGVPVCVVLKRRSKLPVQATDAIHRHDYRMAAECYEKALIFYPDDDYLHLQYGKCLTLLGDSVAAADATARSIALNPASAAAWYLSGRLKAGRHDLSGAVRDWEQALNADPRFSAARIALADGLAGTYKDK